MIVSIIIFLLFFLPLVTKSAKRIRENPDKYRKYNYNYERNAVQGSRTPNRQAKATVSPVHEDVSYIQPVKQKKISSGRLLAKTMDDRENDWLAMQLRDERYAKEVVSEMFSLKQEHFNRPTA